MTSAHWLRLPVWGGLHVTASVMCWHTAKWWSLPVEVAKSPEVWGTLRGPHNTHLLTCIEVVHSHTYAHAGVCVVVCAGAWIELKVRVC